MLRVASDSDDRLWRRCLAFCRWHWGLRTGSELRRPLGITIIGGLIVSQMLTLYTTPVVYLYF